jgi:hypothetical protein
MCHVYIVRVLELVKRLDRWCKAIGVDLQFELPVGVQRNFQRITASAITGERVLSVREHHGADRCLGVLHQHLAGDEDTLASGTGDKGRIMGML